VPVISMTNKAFLAAIIAATIVAAAQGCGDASSKGSGDGGHGGAIGSGGESGSGAGTGGTAGNSAVGGSSGTSGIGGGGGDPGSAGAAGVGGAGGGAIKDLVSGNWTGVWSTDGSFGLSFVVTDTGELRAFTLTDSTTSCGSSGNAEAAFNGPVAIAVDGTFGVTVTGCGPNVHCFTNRIEGRLSPDGTAQGTIHRYGSCSLTCTSVSSGGTDRTWTAARDCRARPTMGVSALRFCDAAGNSHPDPTGAAGTSGGGISCSVTPSGGVGGSGTSGSGGVGGSSPGGAGGSGAGGSASGAGGTGGVTVTDLGESCTNPNCTPASTVCYASNIASCDSGWCMGSGQGTFCSKSCGSDADCTGGARPMKCLSSSCGLPAVVAGHCWDEVTYAACN
jgi:hypothetical protein